MDIRETSRLYAESVVMPWIASNLPHVAGRATVGFLGHGSDVLGLDDALSRDHHHGVRVDILLAEDDRVMHGDTLARGLASIAPAEWMGVPMRSGHVGRSGVSIDSHERFLGRTIGLSRAPESFEEWMQVPEEDVIHVVHAVVWSDAGGSFTLTRNAFLPHWPERVRLRRIAHWCRIASGMGTYAMHRAMARGNAFYAQTRFAIALRHSVQLAFLIDGVYFPYDKWLMAFVPRLGSMRPPVENLLDSTLAAGSDDRHRLMALERFADQVDMELTRQGILRSHPRWSRSATSGYRLLEHAYAEILRKMSEEEARAVPIQDQVHLERFHSDYVRNVPEREWLGLLGLAEST